MTGIGEHLASEKLWMWFPSSRGSIYDFILCRGFFREPYRRRKWPGMAVFAIRIAARLTVWCNGAVSANRILSTRQKEKAENYENVSLVSR